VALDRYDNSTSYAYSDRGFTWEYLGGEPDSNKARNNLLDIDYWSGRTTPVKLDTAVHTLLRYKLLDILAEVVGCPKHQSLKTVTQVSLAQLPKRVLEVSNTIFIFSSMSSSA
jgi:hypothetical protein